MTLEQEILNVIQEIGGIFHRKNIPSVPINIEFLEEKVAPGMEKLVVTELIYHLEDLFADYIKENNKVHKYSRYLDSFRRILDENSEGSSLIGRAKRSA
jgi:hypothetical protein